MGVSHLSGAAIASKKLDADSLLCDEFCLLVLLSKQLRILLLLTNIICSLLFSYISSIIVLLYDRLTNLRANIGNIGTLEQGQKGLQKDVHDLKHGQETLEHGQGALSVALQNLDAKTEKKLDDQLEALKAPVAEAYDLHGERITFLEEEVGIKPRKH